MKILPIKSLLILGSVCICYSGVLHGLESDKRQGIQFSSDGGSSMSTSGDIRILEMKTNVSVTQGTLQINGDEAIFEYKATTNELIRVTVHGSPVRYQQQLDENGGVVTGTSETLLLYTEDSTGQTLLELIGTANITTPDSSMKCASIVYLADQNIIRDAPGPCEGVFNSQSN
ncbi:MAG: hypothetical protein EXR84_08150 [Gammaproteobacteria bacterium]|nr:hypothetical protein [Gammaproteobacteria bacterium]